MSLPATAFWVDRDYDREHASDGISRYGAYLRDATFEPWTDSDQAVEWAVFAWRRATGPVMSPGYVRYHPRVLAARLERSGWDGRLVAGVDLVSSWPEHLRTAAARGVSLGDKDTYWQDWPTQYVGGETISYYEPSEADIAARPYLLATGSSVQAETRAALGQVRPGGVRPSPTRCRQFVSVLGRSVMVVV